MPDISEAEGLPACLVVHHAQVEPPVLLPAVHPVHKTGDGEGQVPHLHAHGRQVLSAAEAEFKGEGHKLAVLQLVHHVGDDELHRLEHPPEEVAKAWRLFLQRAELRLDIALDRLFGERPALLFPQRRDAAARLRRAQDVLEHVVYKGAHLRRVKPGRPPGLCFEAVLQKIGEVAALELVHPGGGEGRLPPVEGAHRLRGEASTRKGVGRPDAADRLHPFRAGSQALEQGLISRLRRQLQRGQRGEQTRRLLQRAAGRAGEHPLQPLPEDGRALRRPVHRLRIAQVEQLRRAGERAVGQGLFPVQPLAGGRGDLQAVPGEQGAVAVGEQAGRLGDEGELAVVHAEQEEGFAARMGDARHVSPVYPVERDRNGTDGVLAEHQAEEVGEVVQLEHLLGEQVAALLQRPDEHLPELAVLLRLLQLPCRAQSLRPLRQPLGQGDLL